MIKSIFVSGNGYDINTDGVCFIYDDGYVIDPMDKSYIKRLGFSDDVTRIGARSFSSCVNLIEVDIPEQIESIGALAFVSCSSLRKVSIHSKDCALKMGIFSNCGSLQEIVCDDYDTKELLYNLSSERVRKVIVV